jgi:hypothetical protein
MATFFFNDLILEFCMFNYQPNKKTKNNSCEKDVVSGIVFPLFR